MSSSPTSTSSSIADTVTASPFALTTTFDPPAACSTQYGQLKNEGYQIFYNPILPVPNTTITSCWASQYVSSYLLQEGGISQATFSPLVCPSGWQVQGPFTSNYIACCPSGFDGLALNTNAPDDRPASGATCYSNLSGVTLLVTGYGDESATATSLYTASISDQAFALPYEGSAYGVAVVPSTTGSSTSTASGSSSSSISTTASATSSASSAASSTAAASSSNSMSSGAVAGAVVGSIAGAAGLLGVMALFFLRRRNKKNRDTESNASNANLDRSASGHTAIPPAYPGRDSDKEVTNGQEKYGGELDAASPATEMPTEKPAQELPGSHASPGESYEMDATEPTSASSSRFNKNLPGLPDQSPTLGSTHGSHELS